MLTENQIQFLNQICPNTWTYNNGVVDVNTNVDISRMGLTEIPVQFGRVDGDFDCDYNELTSLKGGPKEICGFYSCKYNLLTNLIGAPKVTVNYLFCGNNNLTSLEGCPSLIKNNLYCTYNYNLRILYGIGRVVGSIHYDYFHDNVNKWIIEYAYNNIIFKSNEDVKSYIKNNGLVDLKNAPKEIKLLFSSYELYIIDNLY